MDIQIVKKDDMEAVLGLMEKYFQFYEKPIPEYNNLYQHISTFLGGNKFGIQFIAYEDSEPIGFATLYFTYSTLSLVPISIMNDLFVEPKFRGKGVADALFDKCLEYSKLKGKKKMEWVTANDNYRAKKFYDRKGGKGSVWTLYDIKLI